MRGQRPQLRARALEEQEDDRGRLELRQHGHIIDPMFSERDVCRVPIAPAQPVALEYRGDLQRRGLVCPHVTWLEET